MSKSYTYYPGCSSQGSGMHMNRSLKSVTKELGIELRDIPDWNCCGASVGHIEGGHLANTTLSGRNLAQAQEMGPEDVVTPCAACYLNTHYANESIRGSEKLKSEVNEALAAGGRSYDGSLYVRHICEVLVNDIGMDAIKAKVKKPLSGIKVAGYVGCQTVRPFAKTERGGMFDTYDDPSFLDDFTKAVGAEAVPFARKTACCGGSVSVMNPDKTLHLMKAILDEVKESGADMISTPCPLCQTNLEMYQDLINEKFGTDYQFPVVFYTQLMAVAFGVEDALEQNIIKADKLTK